MYIHTPGLGLLSLLSLLSLSSLATTSAPPARSGSTIEALTQASHKLAYVLDTQAFAELDSILTQDVVFDATGLLPFTGGITHGFNETVSIFKRGGTGAKTAHRVTNVLLLEEISSKKVRLSSYIAYSHWVENALADKTKTFRLYYRCEDIWVVQDGAWKLQYVKLYNMGYGAEAPYYD